MSRSSPSWRHAELAVVFGNLLENALESCRRAPSGTATFIRIKARVLSGHLVIVQDNTITEPPRRKDAAFLSSKREGAQPGLGLRSIADLAAAHGGRAEFTDDTEAFHSSVILEL